MQLLACSQDWKGPLCPLQVTVLQTGKHRLPGGCCLLALSLC